MMGTKSFLQSIRRVIRFIRLKYEKKWCWLVIDVCDMAIRVNKICERFIPNLNKNKI